MHILQILGGMTVKRGVLALLLAAVLLTMVFAVKAESVGEILRADVAAKTISRDTVLDLNGHSIGTLSVTNGATVRVWDSETDDYTVSDGIYGRIGTVSGTVSAFDGYLMLKENDGTSFHRLTLDTTAVSLRVDRLETDGASLYYTCAFGGDEVVKRNLAAYGVAMGADKAPDFEDKTYTRITDIANTWTAGKKFTDNGTLVKGIMTEGAADNARNCDVSVQNKAYVELLDGTRILSSQEVSYSLRELMELVSGDGIGGVNAVWDTMSSTQKDALVAFRKAFSGLVEQWSVPRLVSYEEDGDRVELRTADDLKKAATKPYKDYLLMNDIDMSDVRDFVPFDKFTGSFAGNGHTISKLTVNTAAGSAMGLFGTVTENGAVTNLHIEDITLNASDTAATNIGGIVGTNYGTVTGCTATGVLWDTRTGSAEAPIYAGALAGTNSGTLSPGTGIAVSHQLTNVVGDPVTYTTTGLSAQFGFKTADSAYVHTGLVGSGKVSGVPVWRDISYATKFQSEALQERRQTVVDYVYRSGTVKWTVPSTITYYADQATYSATTKPSGFAGVIGGSFHIHNQRFTAGTTYIGIPYNHCASSLEQFEHYTANVGANGVRKLDSSVATLVGGNKKSGNWFSGYTYSQNTGDADWKSGNLGWAKYIGSDCSSALTLAWHKVSPILLSTKDNGGVCLYYTANIVPSQYNQWYYGVRQVGDYVVDDATWSSGTKGKDVTAGGVTMADYGLSTDDIFSKIGATGFYEAYAQTQMGDILISSGTAGHARMAALDPVVIRKADGTIDPAKSYFVTHEQGDGLYERASTNSSWRINYRYTFEQLAYQNTEGLTGSSGYYLPVSMDAFHGDIVEMTDTPSLSGGRKFDADGKNDPAYVVINSGFRLQSATMIIRDAAGKELYNKTAYQGTSKHQGRRRAIPGNIPMFMNEFFGDYGTKLTAGKTYYFTISATTFNGKSATLYDNQAFTYTPAA